MEGTWEPGVHISGIAEGSVGFDNTDSNVVLPDDIAAAVEDIKAKITAGELVPCETAEELDAWVGRQPVPARGVSGTPRPQRPIICREAMTFERS